MKTLSLIRRSFFVFALTSAFALSTVSIFTFSERAFGGTYSSGSSGGDVSLALTHLLPSAFVLPSGDVVIGTSAAIGLFNFAEAYTNLFYDIVGVYNIGAKVSVWSNNDLAIAPYVNYSNQTLQLINSLGAEQDESSTAIDPGIVISYRLASQLTAHSGVMFSLRNPSIPQSSLQYRTSYIQGTTLNQELTVGLGGQWALSPGLSYDATYDIWGAGASLHIGQVQIGGQYYFNVSQGNFIPILGAGYSTSL